MNTLVSIHPWTGYVVSVVLLAVVVFGLIRMRGAREFSAGPYVGAAVAMDLQVTLGIVIWIFEQGWSLGPVLGIVHPLLGILALGAAHGGVGAARQRPDASGAHRTATFGLLGALILVLASIGIVSAA